MASPPRLTVKSFWHQKERKIEKQKDQGSEIQLIQALEKNCFSYNHIINNFTCNFILENILFYQIIESMFTLRYIYDRTNNSERKRSV